MKARPAVQPELTTERLLLRGFRRSDVDALLLLAGERDIALNTLNIPHPYERHHAIDWIVSHPGQYDRRESVTYAVTLKEDGTLVGAAGLIVDAANETAELGYWIGKPYWGRGYASEAGRAVVAWGFAHLELHRVHASHFPRNPASGAVLRKIGMRHEGTLREHVKKWGEHLDLERYGVLRHEFEAGGVVRSRDGH